MRRPRQSGFTLLESIVSLIILSLIGLGFVYYMAWGTQGYVMARDSTAGSMAAQIALERLSFEIKAVIPRTDVALSGTTLTYQTAGNMNIPNDRTLVLDTANGRMTLDGNLLLDGIETSSPAPTIALNTYNTDIDGDGDLNDIQSVVITFALAALPSMTFTKTIHPRGLVTTPSP